MLSHTAIPLASSYEATLYLNLASALSQKPQKAIEALCAMNDWQTILRYAGDQMIITELAWNLLPYEKDLPQDVAEYLDAIYALNRERNEAISQWLEQCIAALNQHGVTPIVLKGSAKLLTRTGIDIGYRMQSDIDILVEPSAMEAACDSLLKQGFQFSTPRRENNQERLVALAQQKPSHWRYNAHLHLPPLIHEDAPCCIELHRHCVSRRFHHLFPLKDLFNQATEHQRNEARFYTMNSHHQQKQIVFHDFVGGGHYAAYQLPLRLALSLCQSEPTKNTTTLERIAYDSSHFLLQQKPLLNTDSQQFVNQLMATLNGRKLTRLKGRLRKTANAFCNFAYNPGKIAQKLR